MAEFLGGIDRFMLVSSCNEETTTDHTDETDTKAAEIEAGVAPQSFHV
jgi:hypothetical protein